ncbi:MAG: DUF481 domain-containing protein [Shimia sp.]
MTLATRLGAATILSFVAGSAFAQTTGVFTGVDAAENRVENIEEQVQDDFERSDRDAFGNTGRALGFYGSVSGRATATDGNSDTVNVGIGSRFGFFDGINGYDVTLSYTYGEANDTTDANSFLGSFDYTRDLNERLYGFGQLRYSYDEFASFEDDAFIGVGLGYRVVATPDTTFDVQAGPGYRYLEDANGNETDEAAFIVEANYLQRFADNLFLTNDTEVLYSDVNTTVTNDLGFNVSLNEGLALRTSLLTEYNTDPLPGRESTDNTLGLSVVYSFN